MSEIEKLQLEIKMLKKEIEACHQKIASLENELIDLEALNVWGVDNWIGYSEAMSWAEKVRNGEDPDCP